MIRGNRGMFALLMVVVIVSLACGAPLTPPAAPTVFDPTKAVLELQGTAMALQLTQAALGAPQQPPPAPAAMEQTPSAPPEAAATPTAELKARIQSAKILLYEDTDELGIGQWIQDALDGMDLDYTPTGSYSGRFMQYLNSGVKYDLII